MVFSCKFLHLFQCKRILRLCVRILIFEVFNRRCRNIPSYELLESIIIKIIGRWWYGSLSIVQFSLTHNISEILTGSKTWALNHVEHWLLILNLRCRQGCCAMDKALLERGGRSTRWLDRKHVIDTASILNRSRYSTVQILTVQYLSHVNLNWHRTLNLVVLEEGYLLISEDLELAQLISESGI